MIYLAAFLALLGFIGIGVYEGYTHGESHIQAQRDASKLEQERLVAQAQAQVIAAQNAQEAATQAVTQEYETKLQAANASSDALSGLVRQYTARLRARGVPQVSGAPSGADPTPAGTGGGSAIDQAASNAIQACEHDSTQLASLIEWVGKVSN